MSWPGPALRIEIITMASWNRGKQDSQATNSPPVMSGRLMTAREFLSTRFDGLFNLHFLAGLFYETPLLPCPSQKLQYLVDRLGPRWARFPAPSADAEHAEPYCVLVHPYRCAWRCPQSCVALHIRASKSACMNFVIFGGPGAVRSWCDDYSREHGCSEPSERFSRKSSWGTAVDHQTRH